MVETSELITATEMQPFARLASEVLFAAVKDYKRIMSGASVFWIGKPFEDESFKVSYPELVGFFQSDWCDDLCAMCGLDYEVFLERLGLTAKSVVRLTRAPSPEM